MRKGSMAIVLAALLVATIAGVVWARPNQATEAVTRKVTVPAAFFHPIQDGLDWNNSGVWLALDSGSGVFTAPVIFPCVEWVTVKKITFSVDDNNASADACATLYRTSPTNLSEAKMAETCSSGSGGAHNPTDSTIDNAQVYPNQGPYVWLSIGGTNIAVYGVTIEYKRHI